jgi:hypothetical protein
VQWDDERVPRVQSLALFDALASAEKTLHANPGKHGEVPASELDSTLFRDGLPGSAPALRITKTSDAACMQDGVSGWPTAAGRRFRGG